MTYLSQLVLNPAREGTRKLLSNRERLHAALANSIPADRQKEERLLFRLDTKNHDPKILVLSRNKPSFEHIIETAGRSNDPRTIMIKDYSPVLENADTGNGYNFYITLNPTKQIHKKTVPLIEKQLFDWFPEKAQINGFGIENFKIVKKETVSFIKKRSMRVTLQTYDLAGTLTVLDKEKFLNTLLNGFGTGKAYGCGLITISR